MDVMPLKNDVMIVEYGFDRKLWYVHERVGDFVLVGPKTWSVSCFIWWSLGELNQHNATVVGRCIRLWPFRFFKLKRHNVEVTGAARLYRAASGGPQGYAS